MATRSIKVEFLPVDVAYEVTNTPEVHDVTVPEDVTGAPRVLENPHVDFPGEWTLVGEGEGGVYRYARSSAVANTNETSAG